MAFTPLPYLEDAPPKGGVDKKEGRAGKWPQKGGERGVKRLREGKARWEVGKSALGTHGRAIHEGAEISKEEERCATLKALP
jgi:hypothetical protein